MAATVNKNVCFIPSTSSFSGKKRQQKNGGYKAQLAVAICYKKHLSFSKKTDLTSLHECQATIYRTEAKRWIDKSINFCIVVLFYFKDL